MLSLKIRNIKFKAEKTLHYAEKPYTTNDDTTLEAHKAQTLVFIHHRRQMKRWTKKHANAPAKQEEKTSQGENYFPLSKLCFLFRIKANETAQLNENLWSVEEKFIGLSWALRNIIIASKIMPKVPLIFRIIFKIFFPSTKIFDGSKENLINFFCSSHFPLLWLRLFNIFCLVIRLEVKKRLNMKQVLQMTKFLCLCLRLKKLQIKCHVLQEKVLVIFKCCGRHEKTFQIVIFDKT